MNLGLPMLITKLSWLAQQEGSSIGVAIFLEASGFG